MSLRFLEVKDLRCIEHAQLSLDEHCTVICGENGSGKTSLLESIFLLGYGRSFRTHRFASLVRSSQREFLVTAKLKAAGGDLSLGIQGGKKGRDAKLNGCSIRSFADLAAAFPVQAIDPDVHQLIEDGPVRRRRYLDWGAFHVEPQFLPAWKRYQRALAQRNTCLRYPRPGNFPELWDQELIESGSIMAANRAAYIEALKPLIRSFGGLLLGEEVEISHRRGWSEAVDLQRALIEALPADRMRGASTIGPHRADVVVSVGGMPAKDRVSRGQQKLLASALILAQQAHRASLGLLPASLLVDDPAAELDVDNLGKLLAALTQIPTQLVITSLCSDLMDRYLPAKLFHVKHGKVREMA